MARLVLLAGFFLSLVCFTEAYNFYVGVRNGWVLKPSEKYNSWAERMRFQVKDKLIFDYKKGEDSVLVVKKEDYESCNTKNPIKKFEDGKSVFIFDRSGPFFFISGADGHCAQGQKLIVVVMAVRNKPIHPPSSPAIPPSTSSPSPSISPSPAPAVKAPTSSPSPAPAIKPPSSSSPSPAPATKTPFSSPSPAPIAISPSSSPSPTPSSSTSPTISPASSQAKSPSPASELSTPPSSSTPGSGGSGGGGGVPATPTSSSNSTSTPTSASAQTQSISRLSYAIFTLFLGAVVVLF